MRNCLISYIKIIDRINHYLEIFVTICLSFLTIAVFGQVLARQVHISVPFLDEIARYTNIYMGFVAAAIGVRTNNLIKIDTFHIALKGKAKEIVIEISRCISLIFIILMIYSGLLLVEIGLGQTSPSLEYIRMSYVYCIIPITFVFSVFNWFAHTVERWVNFKK